LEYALTMLRNQVEGFMWEYECRRRLEELGFEDIEHMPKYTPIYDYRCTRNGETYFIQCKLHGLKSFRLGGRGNRERLARFLLEEGNLDRFLVFGRDTGLQRLDGGAVAKLSKILEDVGNAEPAAVGCEPSNQLKQGVYFLEDGRVMRVDFIL